MKKLEKMPKENVLKINKEGLKQGLKQESLQSEDVKNSKALIVTISVIILLFAIILGSIIALKHYNIGGKPYKVYNNFKFYKVGSKNKWFWQTFVQYQGQVYEVLTYYYPTELLNIQYDANVTNALMGCEKVFIATNPDYNVDAVIAATEISKILGKIFEKTVKGAFTKPSSKDVSRPVVSCENATSNVGVVILVKGESLKASIAKQHCVVITAPDEQGMIRVADLIVYKMLGIA